MGILKKMAKVIIENLTLDYPLFNEGDFQLRNSINSFLGVRKKEKVKVIKALKNVNLTLNDGDRLGLTGPNGCGKSTLLKVISGIYSPNHGSVKIEGEIFPLLDVGMGLIGDMTGMENIYSIAYSRGFAKSEVERSINWIVEFAGLGEAINRTVRTYSSGMVVRLACSVLLSQKPDIFVIDEFFGAGDKNFTEKVENQLKENIKDSGIFVFASHSEELIKKTCNKIAIFEEPGIIKEIVPI